MGMMVEDRKRTGHYKELCMPRQIFSALRFSPTVCSLVVVLHSFLSLGCVTASHHPCMGTYLHANNRATKVTKKSIPFHEDVILGEEGSNK